MGQIGDRSGKGSGQCGDQDVAVFDVPQFMCHDAGQLLVGQEPHDAGGGGDCGVIRITAGCKGVRAVVLDHIHLRHRQPGPLGQASDNAVETGIVLFLDRLCPVHPEHDLVRKPVGEEIHPASQQKGHGHASSAADCAADQYQQHRQESHQKCRFQRIHNYPRA